MAPNCAKGHRLTDSSVSRQGYDPYYENGYTCSICSDHYSDVEGHYDVTSGERWFCDDWCHDECLRCLPRATADARPEESAFAEVRPRLLLHSPYPLMYCRKWRQRHLLAFTAQSWAYYEKGVHAIQRPSTLEYHCVPQCYLSHRLHDGCCTSLVGRVG